MASPRLSLPVIDPLDLSDPQVRRAVRDHINRNYRKIVAFDLARLSESWRLCEPVQSSCASATCVHDAQKESASDAGDPSAPL